MANIEKHPKPPLEQLEQANLSAAPARARAVRLIDRNSRNQQSDAHGDAGDEFAQPVIVRLEDVPATPSNLDRIRERVRLLNCRLAASGTPFRLRVI